MNILLITDSYPPEIRSASNLMLELAEELTNFGHKVFVVTTYPKYNITKSDYKDYCEFSVENNVNVIRIKVLPHHKVNFVIRGISQFMMPYVFFRKVKKYIGHVDATIVYSPPLTLSVTGKKVKKYYNALYILNIQDLFPQNAIDLGILKNKLLIKLFQKMEYYAYRNADIITVHSEGNLTFLTKAFPQFAIKMTVLHNWIDVKEYENISETGIFRKKYKLNNKFVVLFAGVIGPSQGLEFVINVAEHVKDKEDIVFLIVGDGMEKNKLVRVVENKKLKNIIFKPFISKTEYLKLLKDIDIGLVSLTSKNKTPVVPGKILGYMAAGKPILAFLNKESDGHRFIEKAKCGYSSEWGKLDEAVNNLIKLYSNKKMLDTMAKNSLKYVKDNFESSKIIKKILFMLQYKKI